MDPDARIRWGARLLTVGAAMSFFAWIFVLNPLALLVAILFGVAAYAFFLVDRSRNLAEIRGYGSDAEDRVQVPQAAQRRRDPAQDQDLGGLQFSPRAACPWRVHLALPL